MAAGAARSPDPPAPAVPALCLGDKPVTFRDVLLSGVSGRSLELALHAHTRHASRDPLLLERRFIAMWLYRSVGVYIRSVVNAAG